ncbi:MAG TPA: response regulator, partial [Anaerolineae bacterium]|nr:response regulator [Anaerolineae bacterium]
VEMPVMDGYQAVEWIMAHQPTPILVLTDLPRDQVVFQMLGAGALDVMTKPSTSHADYTELLRKIKVLAGVRVIHHPRGKLGPRHRARPSSTVPASSLNLVSTQRESLRPFPQEFFPVVAVASSAGGPQALSRLLADLPGSLPAAVLIVQHIAPGFVPGLVEWLDRESQLAVRLAAEGDRVEPGVVCVAPDHAHMKVRTRDVIELTYEEPEMNLRPAADVLLRSVAEVYGPRAIGVILTGMGRDGAQGALAIKQAGGYVFVQDKSSCSVFGMPRAAIAVGAADEVVPLDKMAQRLVEYIRRLGRVKPSAPNDGGRKEKP